MSSPRAKRSSGRRSAGLLLAIGAFVSAAPSARADAYKDEKLGFSLNAPAKWKVLPIATDERWLVAEFQSPRPYEGGDPKTRQWAYHEPKLDVVIIPNGVGGGKGAERAPWTNLREYLDKTTQDSGIGGYHFSKEEETKVGDLKVMFYEITVDKLVNAPRKIYGWAFYSPDAIYGLVGDALVKFEDKIKPDLDAAVRSFRIFPRTGTLAGGAVTPGTSEPAAPDKDAKKEHLTPEDLKRARAETVNRRLARIKETLADGWKIKESDNFIAVTHCDEKFTREVLDHAEALRAWLDQTLGYVGSGYAGRIILRVCADEDERSAMWKSMKWSADRCEIVTGQDRRGWSDNKMSELNSGIYSIWLRDRNPQLSWSLPRWISSGLDSCVSSAVSKGRRITDFKATTWDTVEMNNLRRADKLFPARAFFTMDSEALWKDYENHRQAEAFVRYLLVGGAQRSAKYKNVLADYVKNLAMLIDESQGEKKADVKAPETEEEESALFRERQEAWKKREQEVLKKLLDQTFPGWDEKDWTQFNAAYGKELGA